ncbi:MAG: hypothetical protein NWF07_04840 [Candidatus Bathyarchaeota archaeon]|nr:hypothetical protein [Candidatus Bathyarchaeota archaeon]
MYIKDNDKDEYPGWIGSLIELDNGIGPYNYSEANRKKSAYSTNEIGLIHPENGSYMKVADDGDIDIFASEILGIKMDAQTESLRVSAAHASIIAKDLSIMTNPAGLSWNGYYLNPALYSKTGRGAPEEDKNLKLKCTVDVYNNSTEVYETKEVSIRPFITKPTTNTYSDDLNILLRDLGLEL